MGALVSAGMDRGRIATARVWPSPRSCVVGLASGRVRAVPAGRRDPPKDIWQGGL